MISNTTGVLALVFEAELVAALFFSIAAGNLICLTWSNGFDE